ncbi:cohesin domain-containing protein [Pseudoduganella aquatica]|uniref:Cohesin domain-containing protein n=1 Tax=Pseudoduganella aquatica TaxID=2660641 RepID=A0A7X4H7H1_9BURK|nr:cohesin domain-containing protein [Pseudoduganella aquatica]MYN06141.1 hypothetical protein [Pseudoduganella aquatica]
MRAPRPMAALACALSMALAAAPCGAAGAAAGPLTLELYNVTLQQAFGELARSCGLVFDFGDGVRTDRRMSLFLKDADPESVLYYALRANSLAMLPPREGRALLVLAEETDDAPTVAIGTPSLLIEVNKDEADVQQQRARLQPPPAAAPAAASIAAAPAAQSAGTLLDWKIRPRSRVGSNFTVQLFLRSDRQVDAVPLTISFDGQAFEVVRVEAGSYWGVQSSLASRVDPGGTITLEAAHPAGASTGPGSGDAGRSIGQPGLLASITFRAAAAAPAAHIQIVAARAVGSDGNDIGVAVPLRHAMQVQP